MDKSKIVQISEEQAKEMSEIARWIFNPEGMVIEWERNGFIKKSALEEARDFFDVIEKNHNINYGLGTLIAIKEKYEQAIKEILEWKEKQ